MLFRSPSWLRTALLPFLLAADVEAEAAGVAIRCLRIDISALIDSSDSRLSIACSAAKVLAVCLFLASTGPNILSPNLQVH